MRSTCMGLLFLVAMGCGQHKVAVSYMAPGQMDLGKGVDRVLLLDQTRPGDVQSSTHTLEGLREVLEASHRFEAVTLATGTAKGDEARTLCSKADCDAVISLDTLTGQEDLEATFRTLAKGGRSLDQIVIAVDPVELGLEHEKPLERELGASYGRRIAPHEEIAIRTLYGDGSPELRKAIAQVEAGHWNAAGDTWRQIAKSSGSARDIARARHNLAVAAEREGRLDRALQLARNADDILDRRVTSDYVLVLEQRWVDGKRMARVLPGSVARR